MHGTSGNLNFMHSESADGEKVFLILHGARRIKLQIISLTIALLIDLQTLVGNHMVGTMHRNPLAYDERFLKNAIILWGSEHDGCAGMCILLIKLKLSVFGARTSATTFVPS